MTGRRQPLAARVRNGSYRTWWPPASARLRPLAKRRSARAPHREVPPCQRPPSPKRLSRKHSRWLAQHGRKRVYRSRFRAWLAIARICVKERQVVSRWRGNPSFLVPYECRWASRWEAGRTGPAHIHIGHQAWRGSAQQRWLRRRLFRPAHQYVIWPYYRARRRARLYKKERSRAR